jgi:hypothetical protein
MKKRQVALFQAMISGLLMVVGKARQYDLLCFKTSSDAGWVHENEMKSVQRLDRGGLYTNGIWGGESVQVNLINAISYIESQCGKLTKLYQPVAGVCYKRSSSVRLYESYCPVPGYITPGAIELYYDKTDASSNLKCIRHALSNYTCADVNVVDYGFNWLVFIVLSLASVVFCGSVVAGTWPSARGNFLGELMTHLHDDVDVTSTESQELDYQCIEITEDSSEGFLSSDEGEYLELDQNGTGREYELARAPDYESESSFDESDLSIWHRDRRHQNDGEVNSETIYSRV